MQDNSIIIFYDNSHYKNRIEYTFDFLFNHYLLSLKKINILYNPDDYDANKSLIIFYTKNQPFMKPNVFWIEPQELIFNSKFSMTDNIYANEYQFETYSIFSVAQKKLQKQLFVQDNVFQFDICEMIFFHLSRYEEFFAKKSQLDHHERMRSSEQFLVKNALQKEPVVDIAVYAISKTFGFKNLKVNTLYSITHDIDAIRKFPSLYKFMRALIRTIIKDKNIVKSLRLIQQYIVVLWTGNDTYNTFDWLFSLNASDEKIVYFMSGGKTKFDNFYSIKDEKLSILFHQAKMNGYTIGLHPSYATPYEKAQFEQEIHSLENAASCSIKNTRQHILHFSFKETIDILESLEIRYDSTLGYEDLIGFRCGTGHDYYLYNFTKEKASTVKEIPLVVMDGPLLMEAEYNVKHASDNLFKFLEERKLFTKITFNFHNSTFDEVVVNKKMFINLYKHLNRYINDK